MLLEDVIDMVEPFKFIYDKEDTAYKQVIDKDEIFNMIAKKINLNYHVNVKGKCK